MTDRPFRRLLSCCLVLLLGAAMALAQDPPKDEDELQKVPKDPYTDEEPKALAAAGYVGYAPFVLADHHGTADVEKVVGRRVLWVETAHFKIGSSLRTVPLPTDQEERRYLTEELKRLKKRLPKVNVRARELDPWLRLHLYAQRMEELYAEFQQRLGIKDADFGQGTTPPGGAYLGMPNKFVLITFQKKGDLARFLERYCNVRNDTSWRPYFQQTWQLGMTVAAEGFEGAQQDDLAIWSHVCHGMLQNLLNGYRGYLYDLPVWFSEGLGHWFARRIPTEFINVRVREDDVVDEQEQHEWARKVRARASFDHFPKTGELIGWQKYEDLNFIAHLMAWSRVDFLLTLGDDRFGVWVKQLKSLPPVQGFGVPPEQLANLQKKLLVELYEMDERQFDARWKAYVLKTYPRK